MFPPCIWRSVVCKRKYNIVCRGWGGWPKLCELKRMSARVCAFFQTVIFLLCMSTICRGTHSNNGSEWICHRKKTRLLTAFGRNAHIPTPEHGESIMPNFNLLWSTHCMHFFRKRWEAMGATLSVDLFVPYYLLSRYNNANTCGFMMQHFAFLYHASYLSCLQSYFSSFYFTLVCIYFI